jgi:hypothetical protein
LDRGVESRQFASEHVNDHNREDASSHQRGLSLKVIENALVLAATRRLIRPPDAPPLGQIRSLAYLLPVIQEVLELRVSSDYFDYLRHKLARSGSTR